MLNSMHYAINFSFIFFLIFSFLLYLFHFLTALPLLIVWYNHYVVVAIPA